jgi:hypothetical protein
MYTPLLPTGISNPRAVLSKRGEAINETWLPDRPPRGTWDVTLLILSTENYGKDCRDDCRLRRMGSY